ncbi:MAG: regulatory protein [Vicingaceae bacterium]|jgi:regulatory protein|tara:strand:+ start:3674 stop:4150 length:477 start_codon:yes stop_codon:yes gene_type:complete
MFKKKQPLSFQEVLSKLMRYCSYQERSPFEVQQKLREYAIPADKVEEIMDLLIDDNFINEERFATLFVRGKVKVKRWGLYKIREGLSRKGVSSDEMVKAVGTIDEILYEENLNYLVDRKLELSPEYQEDVSKMYRYLQSKGYEGDKISKVLREKKLMN